MGKLIFNYRRFRKIRDSFLKMTQQEVADIIGITVLSYQKWETGKAVPRIDNFTKYMEFLMTKNYPLNFSEWWRKH